MAKSIKSTETHKPSRPYEGFPLFPHASGRWAKKVRQKTRFYGRWANTVAGELVPVDDIEKSAADAKTEFDRCWPYHSQGREAPAPGTRENAVTVMYLCNAFLTAKQALVNSQELTRYSYAEYQRTTDAIMAHFEKTRLVDDLRPDDFQDFRQALAKGCGVVTLKSKINRARVVFKFASDTQLIDRPVDYGKSFDRPKPLALRKARNEAGERLIEASDLRKVLAALEGQPVIVDGTVAKVEASAPMRAMTLLALNAGFGNTDCATLPRSAVNLDTGWIVFPRPKTGVQRRVPLWPETVEAMRKSLAERPAPIDPEDADLCFITSRGTRYIRMQESKTTEKRFVTINSLSRRFEGVLKALKLDTRKGVNFYTLRHCFETHGGECGDQVAVDAIMGHADETMAAQYRERISDHRLKHVVNTVRDWLWPDAAAKSK